MITPTTANVTCACKDVFLYSAPRREKAGIIHTKDECAPVPATPTFSCASCGETYLILGDTELARARALRDWTGCPCTPKDTPEAVVGGLTASGEQDSRADRAHIGTPRQPRAASSRGAAGRRGIGLGLLSGVPRWVARRVAVT